MSQPQSPCPTLYSRTLCGCVLGTKHSASGTKRNVHTRHRETSTTTAHAQHVGMNTMMKPCHDKRARVAFTSWGHIQGFLARGRTRALGLFSPELPRKRSLGPPARMSRGSIQESLLDGFWARDTANFYLQATKGHKAKDSCQPPPVPTQSQKAIYCQRISLSPRVPLSSKKFPSDLTSAPIKHYSWCQVTKKHATISQMPPRPTLPPSAI
jgi:hypothetical protein